MESKTTGWSQQRHKKAFDKVNTTNGHVTLNKWGTEENFPKTTKNLYKTPRVTIILYNERLECFSPNTETRQGGLLSILLFNTVLEVLADIGRQNIKTILK